ncbi:MAG: hypothetical protein ACUVTR_04855 [Dehalococcoidia bacterium]
MPKKSRRAKARHRARVARIAPQERRQRPAQVPAGLQSATPVSSKAQDFASRYQYVIPELKRIGVIAGAMIVVIIILSFVVPSLSG